MKMLRRPLAALLALVLALAVAACSDGRGTPREAFETLRAAAATGDGARMVACYDLESNAFRRARAREWRAQIARGDDVATLVKGTVLTKDDVVTGTLDDVVARIYLLHSPLVRDAAWFRDAQVASETADGEDAARLHLKGADGAERDLWFVRERGKWALDQGRTWRWF